MKREKRERFTASKHWRWCEGMNTGDALVVTTDQDGQITEVVFDGHLMEAQAADPGDDHWYDTRGAVPWMSAATLGCIEHQLLPRAWRGSSFRIGVDALASVEVWRDGALHAAFDANTLGDALLACLEAAP